MNVTVDTIVAAHTELMKLDATTFTKTEAKDYINKLLSLHSLIEDNLSELGVEHQINISLGDYGYGRHLQLETYESRWDGTREAGEWISSSSTC